MKNTIVLFRGKKDEDFIKKLHQIVEDSNIRIIGTFYDYRTGDSNKSFERYEDRLAFTKGVERDANTIIVEKDFFNYIGQDNWLEQKLTCRALSRVGFDLQVINDDFTGLENEDSLFDTESEILHREDTLMAIDRYEKLITTLRKLKKKVANKKKGILTLDGKGKVSGRKSYLEKNPDLVEMTKKFHDKGYTNREISKVLFDMGHSNSKGKELASVQISRIIKQSLN
jgi:hypothetical protein|tara:strand:- start:145 stop:825 length:681 start_codon:yes stop_codon:yes gene_type:complete